MADDFDLEPEEAPTGPISTRAEAEVKQFNNPEPKPNSLVIPLWGKGHISFDPENSVSIFALLALILLLLTVLITTFAGIWIGNVEWMKELANALGHAITGVVGAIVGSSIVRKDKAD